MGRKICKFTYHFLKVLTWAVITTIVALWAIVIITIPTTICHEWCGVSLKKSILINVSIVVGIAIIAGFMKLYELGEEYVLEDKYDKWEHGETSEDILNGE